MSVLTPLQDMRVSVFLSDTGNLKIQGRASQLDRSQIDSAIQYARIHKPAIIAALSQNGSSGQCESCPAAGYWDQSSYAGYGLLCFHNAYYLGKSGKPNPCGEIRKRCPRTDKQQDELPLPPSQRRSTGTPPAASGGCSKPPQTKKENDHDITANHPDSRQGRYRRKGGTP